MRFTDDPFILHDFTTPAWIKLKARMESDLAKARAELEKQALDDKPSSAIRLRARIALLAQYLDLPAATDAASRAHTNT